MSTTQAGTAPSTIAAGSDAATQAAAFADDPRIHFDTQAQSWRFEDDDGNELEFDAAKGAWVPVVSAAPSLSVAIIRSATSIPCSVPSLHSTILFNFEDLFLDYMSLLYRSFAFVLAIPKEEIRTKRAIST